MVTADGKSYVGEIRGGFVEIDGVRAPAQNVVAAGHLLPTLRIPRLLRARGRNPVERAWLQKRGDLPRPRSDELVG